MFFFCSLNWEFSLWSWGKKTKTFCHWQHDPISVIKMSPKNCYMIRKYHNRTLQTNSWHCEEEPQNSNSVSYKTKVKQTALFSIKMIAKLGDKVLSNNTRTKHRTTTNDWSNSTQWIENNRMAALEQTTAYKATEGLKCILLVPYQISSLDSVEVKAQILPSLEGT